MTVRVDKEARARIDNIKNITKETKQHIDHIKKSGGYMSSRVANDFKEIVFDDSYKEILDHRDEKRKWIYTTPDGGKTIYRQPLSYCDVSGVKIDDPEQLKFDFNNTAKKKASARCQAELDFLYVAIEKDKEREKENEVMELVLKMENKISQVVTLMVEIEEEVKKLRDNN